jgi:hypothetical protein
MKSLITRGFQLDVYSNANPFPRRSKERNATRPVLFKILSAPSNGAESSVGCVAINISPLQGEN